MNSFFNLRIIIIFISYSYCDMSSEIIQSVVYDNYNEFQHVNFIPSQKISFRYFEDYLMMKLTLR
jgi:hypothetical protein